MPKTLPMSACTETLHFSAGDYENWKRRGKLFLSTKFPETTAGKTRMITRDNALELALVAALLACNVQPGGAAALANSVIRSVRGTGKYREYLVFAAGGGGEKGVGASGAAVDDLDGEKLSQVALHAGGANAISVICVGDIIRKVDALFSDKDGAETVVTAGHRRAAAAMA